MDVRNVFIAALEKTAEAGYPDYTTDNAAVANEEHRHNMKDSRGELTKLFDNAGSSERNNTSTISRLLPAKGTRETGNPLMKVAEQAFYQAATSGDLLKEASPAFLQVALWGFHDELEKVAAAKR